MHNVVRSYRSAIVLSVMWALGVTRPAIGQHRDIASELATTSRAAEAVFGRPVTVNLNGVTLRDAIEVIAARAGVRIQYRSEQIASVHRPVMLHAEGLPLGVVLGRLLSETSFAPVALSSDVVVLKWGANVAITTGFVQGRVLDARAQQPLRGVAVTVDDTPRGVITGADGMFRLGGVSVGTHRVVVRLIGYVRQAKTVTVTDGETSQVDFVLEKSSTTLDQVVVTGTVVPTALKAVPNVITIITAQDIERRGITRIDQLFRGDVPGLFSQNQGSSLNAMFDQVTMFSRGATALSGSSAGVSSTFLTNPIKTYVDGVEMANSQYLSQIDPTSIERIEILTGPQASTIYGSNAINGVMQIFTKRGTGNTSQLTLNLLSGWVENSSNRALTPQHDYGAQLNGVEGHLSYNAGGSWNYIGAWTPAKQTMHLGSFGGTRLELPMPAGRVTADMSLRRTLTQNRQRGGANQPAVDYVSTGWYTPSSTNGRSVSVPTMYILNGQTLGLTLGYAPASWWSHELVVGQDAEDTEQRSTAAGYISNSDTVLQFQTAHSDRTSLRYTTTAQLPLSRRVKSVITIGGDNWRALTTSLTAQPQTLTGTLSNITGLVRQPDHNAGAFVQTQLGINEQLFFTYGLRAEWNPAYGAEAQPNYAPRYGVVFTHDVGSMTAKVRATYGRSTRPPQDNLKLSQDVLGYWQLVSSPTNAAIISAPIIKDYGDYLVYLANPELAPEHQQGVKEGLKYTLAPTDPSSSLGTIKLLMGSLPILLSIAFARSSRIP